MAGLPVRPVLWLVSVLALCACSRFEDGALEAVLDAERVRSGAQLRTVALDWGDARYLERDGSGPTMVLVHGFNAEKDIWLAFVRALPEDWRVIIPDLPGHGDTPAPAGDITFSGDWFAARLHDVLQALGVREHHLAGNSLGGMIAAQHALAHPDSVISLALLDPAGVVSPQRSDVERMVLDGDNPLIVRSVRDFERLMELVYVDPPLVPWPAKPALVRRMAARAPFLQAVWRDLWLHSGSLEPLLPELAMPTLVLWGREDRVLHVSAADVFASAIPVARRVVFDGVGHSPMSEAPELTAGAWLAFLRDHGLLQDGDGAAGDN